MLQIIVTIVIVTLAKAKVKHIYSRGIIYDRQNIFIVQATGCTPRKHNLRKIKILQNFIILTILKSRKILTSIHLKSCVTA